MISKLVIKNYKSIDELELELGRTNVFIGANGGGKSNILEAVGMAAAAAANKLDNEFLLSRGIRVTDPARMRSGFTRRAETSILIRAHGLPNSGWVPFVADLRHDDSPFGQWTGQWTDFIQPPTPEDKEFFKRLAEPLGFPTVDDVFRALHEKSKLTRGRVFHLSEFLTFAPHEEALRDLARESNIEPIGIHGEGLFRLLQALTPTQLSDVKQRLSMIHWFEDLALQPGPSPSAHSLKIVDQYLADGLAHFDQRSANEGFLFLLLYACLLVSEYTPRFFAVDNVDAALNPKLAAAAVRMFCEMTKAHDRQVLLTAHNPGALDGLDLTDDEQRLFVVYRDVEGRTRVRRVPPPSDTATPVRLSEAFLRGYLGGLPDHF